MFVCYMITIQARVFMCNILTTFQINEAFFQINQVRMRNNVTSCVIFI